MDAVQFQFADDLEPGTGYTPQEVDALLSVSLDDVEAGNVIIASDATESLYASPNEGSGTVPWKIQRSGGCPDGKPYAVVKESDGSVAGCHPTHGAAVAQLRALYAHEKNMSELEVDLTADDMKVLGVDDPGYITLSAEAFRSDHNLREYWTHGEGAVKIRWGEPGDFMRCVHHLEKFVRDPKGLCNEYHVEAIGVAPGQEHSGETESFALTPADGPVQRVDGAGPNDLINPQPMSVAWEGVLAVEGVETGDGRMFAPGSLTWPELPIPLMYQYITSHGGSTDESTNVGNIASMWRDGNKIMGNGYIDVADQFGMQAARKMKGKYLRGVSIDADSVKDSDVELVYAQPDPGLDEDANALQALFANPELTIFHTGRVRGATLVNLPAFVEASLNLIGDTSILDSVTVASAVVMDRMSDETTHVITAAATGGKRGYTIEIPELPPIGFFEEPAELPPIGAVWIEPNGHIFGLVGPSDVAHRAFKGKRVTIPMGNVDYTRWMNRPTPVVGYSGEVLKIRTGVITMNCGHLMDFGVTDQEERMRHYDNSCSIAAVARVGESREHRVPWISGMIMPMSIEDFQRFQACQLSGDWTSHRERRGWKEFVAALAVPVPGFARGTDVAAVRVDDNAVVVASSVPIRLTDAAYDEDSMTEALTSSAYESNRLALGRIRARVGSNNRQTLADIRQRVSTGRPLVASAGTATLPPKEKKTVGCAPCAAKAARQRGETSAQEPPVQTVSGFGDGDSQQQAATSQENAIANSRTTSRG
jgi:hypothetical protein